ncbi:MAG: GTPase HflX [Spirochaetia bacterium]|nr:GTPase HflX [Spirochaetia bacterium]
MHSNKTSPLSAVLVGIQLPGVSDAENEASLQELSRLVNTLGYRVLGQLSQKRSSQKSANILGEGKLKTLAEWTGGSGVVASRAKHIKSKAALRFENDDGKEKDAESEDDEPEEVESEESSDSVEISSPKEKVEVVIFDCDLSPSQLRILESATGATVLDRTGVIIEIFSRHARTRAAKLQVEIARLAYVAPRLRETGGGEDRQGGGIGSKGAGETSLELDRRKIRDRIKELKHELDSVGQEHSLRRSRREQECCVALVGYTNAGKSSLMRAMTGSEVLVADKLFATLDTTVRPIHPETRPKILLSDTVGFIKKLPHDLVASFKSTLDEALNASLLLFVVDAADLSFRSQLEVTRKVLAEVGAGEWPSLLLLNKRDKLSPEQVAALQKEFPEAFLLSSRDPRDLAALREKILAFFEKDMAEEDLFIPYNTEKVIGEIRAHFRVLGETYGEGGVVYKVRGKKEDLGRLKARHHLPEKA